MSTDAQKTPIARTLETFAERKVRNVLALTGKALPASIVAIINSGIVEIKFELNASPYTLQNMTVPVAGAEFVRMPFQIGTLGWVQTADVFLGGMSGLGTGTADLRGVAVLSALVWSPIGNVNWTPSENPNAIVLYGPDGFVLRDSKKTMGITGSPETGITISPPAGLPVTVNGQLAVTGDLLLTGNFKGAAGIPYAGDIRTTGEVIAKSGRGQVTLSGHGHIYKRASTAPVEDETGSGLG